MYATRKKAFWPLLFLVVTAGGVGNAQEYKDGFAENNTLSLAELIHYAQELATAFHAFYAAREEDTDDGDADSDAPEDGQDSPSGTRHRRALRVISFF